MYKKLYHYGFVAYAVMFVLSLFFYKERMFFLDTAYNLFHIAMSGNVFLHATREGALLTQLLPLAGIKLGLSLNVVTQLYSVGFVLYFAACYFVCGSLLKQPEWALVVLLSSILSLAHTFYYTPSELPQGTAFLMVVLAYASNASRGGQRLSTPAWVLFTIGIVAGAFFHPLVLFVLVFTLGYFYRLPERPIPKSAIIVAAFAFVGTTAYKILFMRLDYDGRSMSGLKNIVKLFPNYVRLYSNSLFLHNCFTLYYWLPVLFVAITVYYGTQKQWLRLGYFLAAFMGYLFMVNVSFPDSSTPIFYRENLLLPLTFFVALPLVFELIPMLAPKKLAVPLLAVIIVSGCIRLYATNSFYTGRLAWERGYMADKMDKKLLINAATIPQEKLVLLWGTPFEFFVIGECEHHKTVSLIIDDDPGRFGWALNSGTAFLTTWQVYRYEELRSGYFHFTDSIGGYKNVP